MSTMARRGAGPMSELMDWLESSPTWGFASLRNFIRVEDYMEGDDYVVRAEMPGIDPEKDVEVTIEDELLTIRGQRREEERDKFHNELRYGSFARSIRLPGGAKKDAVSAKYDAGVLEVRVPVGEVTAASTKVPVQRTGS